MNLETIISNAHALDLKASKAQASLTKRHLEPKLREILEVLGNAREQVDAEFIPKAEAARQSGSQPLPGELHISQYPIGHCRYIRDRALERFQQAPLIREIVSQGLTLKPVFIFLKESYFQNAIQFGNYYFDAANDTVFVDKPKLDHAPIKQLDYENVNSWQRFAAVARKYLHIELYPNLHFPLAFPAVPFFAIRPNGRLDMLLAQHQIAIKDLGDEMRRCCQLLADDTWMHKALPAPYQDLLEKSFGGNFFEAFPLEYAPSTPQQIQETIVTEFIESMRAPSAQTYRTVSTYFELIEKSVRILRSRNLIPSPEILHQLREQGVLPMSHDSVAGTNAD